MTAAAFAAVFLLFFQSASRAAPRDSVVLAMLGCAALFNAAAAVARRGRGGRFEVSRRVTLLTIGVFVLTTIGGNVGVAGALARLGPGITGTILQVQIFLVALGGRLFLGERLTPAFLLGAGLAFGGFVVLGASDPADGRIDPAGVGFALLAAACFGGMLLWTRAVITQIEPVLVNVTRLGAAALILALLPGRLHGVMALPSSAWLAILGAACCGPFLSRLALMYASVHLEASRLKLITLVSPVLAFVLEWLVLGSAPTPHELGAGSLILGGVMIQLGIEARSSDR